ncbi:unnamed protein product [Rhodiola kirilowii]
MNLPPRQVAQPVSLKRKERDHFRPHQPVLTKSLKPPPPRLGSAHSTKSEFPAPNFKSGKHSPSAPLSKPASTHQAEKPKCNNFLLAGYMAHEFLTMGTVMGEKLYPARASAVPPIKRSSHFTQPSRQAEERYAEVTSMLKTDGAHIPGIVNPTQLASYLNL